MYARTRIVMTTKSTHGSITGVNILKRTSKMDKDNQEQREKKQEKLNNYQNVRYINLSNQIGEETARFCMCAAFNYAYDPDIDCVSFEDYVDQIGNRKFRDGMMQMEQQIDVTDAEMRKWKAVWGIGDKSKPYSVEDYQKLDQTFETYAARLEKAGGMDALQEDTLRSCSKMRLEADKALVKGGKDNIAIASTLSKMIQEQLASEQLRKRDEKPIGIAKLDGIVEALARKYGSGAELTYEEATKICSQWLLSHKYPHTMDAAEHMLLAIINTTRQNNDMPIMPELPEEAKFPESMESEFAEKPNEAEKEAYEYLNITRGKTPTFF